MRLITLIDLSEYSEAVLRFADAWSKAFGAELLLVHQVEWITPTLTHERTRKELVRNEKNEAREALDELQTRILSTEQKVGVHVTEENLVPLLQRLEEQGQEDLILLGLKGKGKLGRIFIGSSALRVIEGTESITVAIPKGIDELLPRILHVAVSPKYPIDREAFEGLLQGVREELEAIEFMSIVLEDDDERASKELIEELQEEYRKRGSSSRLFRGDDAFGAIRSHLGEGSGGMLLVQRGSRKLRDYMFRRFLINDVVYDASIPLIVLP
jgi:nucleotide-binding universal stress UspA family protein